MTAPPTFPDASPESSAPAAVDDADTAESGASRRESRREAQNALGREHVLDAAEEVFSRKGFHEATIKEISKVAEFSVGAVYGFFENKDDLFAKVMERRGADLVPAMRHLIEADEPPRLLLHRLADLQIEFFRSHPAFARLFVRATGAPLLNIKASVGEATRARYDEAMALQATLFGRGQADGSLVEGPPHVLAEVFSGIILAFQTNDPVVVGGGPPATDPQEQPWTVEAVHAMIERAFVLPTARSPQEGAT